jgi:segregation and condensation protein A
MEAEDRMHPRQAGLEIEYLRLMPDYLEGVTLRGLAVICADLLHRRDVFLLEAEHVASMPISLELHAESVHRQLVRQGTVRFSEIIEGNASAEVIVVTLLAILELYKRGLADITQDHIFGEIVITHIDDEEAARRGLPEDRE